MSEILEDPKTLMSILSWMPTPIFSLSQISRLHRIRELTSNTQWTRSSELFKRNSRTTDLVVITFTCGLAVTLNKYLDVRTGRGCNGCRESPDLSRSFLRMPDSYDFSKRSRRNRTNRINIGLLSPLILRLVTTLGKPARE